MARRFFPLFVLFFSFFSSMSTHGKLLLTLTQIVEGGAQVNLSDEISLDVCNRSNLSDRLVTNPSSFLEQNANNFIDIKPEDITPAWFYDFNDRFPLGTLTECSNVNCSLDRIKTPLWRKYFEDGVVSQASYLKPTSEKLVYASFGSGGLFSDLVLLTKLIKYGYKNLEVHLIDIKYREIISIISEQKNNRAYDDIFDDTHQARGYWLRMNVYRLTQLLNWFAKEKNINISLYLYGNAESYVNACDLQRVDKADVLVAIDFIDEMTDKSTFDDLCKLARNALKEENISCLAHNRGEPFLFFKCKNDTEINSDLSEGMFTNVNPIYLKASKYALQTWYNKPLVGKILVIYTIAGYCMYKAFKIWTK